MAKFEAEMAVFITHKEPSAPMLKAAAAAGTYKHPLMGREYPRIKIVTIRDMIQDGAHLDLPMPLEVLKKAARAKESAQNSLLDAAGSGDDA